MATIDVRNEGTEEITSIVFADEFDADGDFQANILCKTSAEDYICIYDTKDYTGDCVSVSSKEHALNLIKAINKAIELGWVK